MNRNVVRSLHRTP